MMLFAFLSELLMILLCCVIRTVAAADILPMLVIFSVMKLLYCRKNPDSFRHNPQLPAACLMLEFAAVTSLYAGYADARSVRNTALIAAAAMTVGYAAVYLLRKHQFRFSPALVFGVLIGCIIFRCFADDESTDTYNWISVGPVTVQYSELLKLLSVAAFAAACTCYREHAAVFLYYYGYQVLNVLLLALLQEFGTAMEFIFATCISAALVLPFPGQKLPLKQHCTHCTFPAATLAVLCVLLLFGKKMLAAADASGSGRMILGHTVHFWNIRLNSTGEETRRAAECMRNSPLIRANLTGFQSFRTMKPSVMTDYVFTLMVENFGWLIPLLLIAVFTVVMLRIAGKHRRRAAEGAFFDAMALGTAILLLTQAAIHILGPLRILPFSGITLPFVSSGFNSLIVCCLLLTATEHIADLPEQPPETALNVIRLRQDSFRNESDDRLVMSDEN